MRKLFLTLAVILLLLVSVPLVLIASGTISTSSLRMVLNVMTGYSGDPVDEATVAGRFQVPEGFSIGLFAADLPRARFLHVTPTGDVLVSRPHEGDIMLLHADEDGDGRSDGREVLLGDLRRPLGIDLHAGWLYVAESDRIGRVPFDSQQGRITGSYESVVEGLGDNGNHWSKTLGFGPGGALYLAQGSSCNVCVEEDPRRATMMRFNADGSGGEIIATGLRNSVGFDWAPWNGALYATDNGRDMLGDNFPPCELNRIEAGTFYGWPYYNGANVPDPDMGQDPEAGEREPTPPVHDFRAHNAPLGIAFIDGSQLPERFQRSALVALHGSWNRSEPDGYKVVSLHWSEAGIEERDFLWGLNVDGKIYGRPVDVAQAPDGAIYISDDYAGAIYRVAYGDAAAARGSPMPDTEASRLDAEPPAWLAQADLPQLAQRGRALYAQYGCATCHNQGENARRLDNLDQRLGYRAVIDALEAPQSPMPVYPLSREDRRALAVFLLTPELAVP